jgi:hypothetical protein
MAISSNGLAGLKPGVIDNAAARPSSPFEGQLVYEKDIDMLAIWNGTEWGYIYSSAGNLLINGAMQVTQRSAVGTAVTGITSGGFKTADRWDLNLSSLGTWIQTTLADAPTGSGFCNCIKLDCSTAQASPAGGAEMQIRQKIEGQNLQAIRKGTASAQTVTLSFWVKSFQTGTFICELEDGDNNRNVSKSYTVNASNTWEYKTVTFPADTTGAFDNDANASLVVIWWLGAGSNFTSGTLATTWVTPTTANRAVGQTNVASATTGEWFMTGAQLTVGSVATPFEFKSYADDLRDCQRYFYKATFTGGSLAFATGYAATANIFYWSAAFPVTMRGVPSLAQSSMIVDANVGGGALTGAMTTKTTAYTYGAYSGITTSLTAGQGGILQSSSSASYIQADAEL